MRGYLIILFVSLGLAELSSAQENPKSGKDELLPAPTPVPNPASGVPGQWSQDPKTGEWIAPDGIRWKFDGLRWRVLWLDRSWHPVIPPGPLPSWWTVKDAGQGWAQVLPANSSTWHIVPPAVQFMPPPYLYPSEIFDASHWQQPPAPLRCRWRSCPCPDACPCW